MCKSETLRQRSGTSEQIKKLVEGEKRRGRRKTRKRKGNPRKTPGKSHISASHTIPAFDTLISSVTMLLEIVRAGVDRKLFGLFGLFGFCQPDRRTGRIQMDLDGFSYDETARSIYYASS